jgi:hypothetical protein
MTDKLITTYMVELLYQTTPTVDGNRLFSELKKRCGKVEQLGDNEKVLLFAFPEHAIEYRDGKVPPQIFLTYVEKDQTNDQARTNLSAALTQSWGWPEASQVVATCKGSLLLTELMAQALDYKTRLELFHQALESVLMIAPCQAIHWTVSQQVIDPATYLTSRQVGEFHPLQLGVNVRFFNISNRQPGEMLMDTMGLATLGLPDLQCHFVDLDPNEVSHLLFNTAYYLYENGDIIEDGNTIQGIKQNDQWRCQHESALVPPARIVMDLNPGHPFAAGKLN